MNQIRDNDENLFPQLRKPYEYNVLGDLRSVPALLNAYKDGGPAAMLNTLVTMAIEEARRNDPDAEMLTLGVSNLIKNPLLLNILKPLLGERFSDVRTIEVVYGINAGHRVMKMPEVLEKGSFVEILAWYLGGEEGAENLVTASYERWRLLQPLINEFLSGKIPLKQAERVVQTLKNEFNNPENFVMNNEGEMVYSLNTLEIRNQMFMIIGKLLSPLYNPSSQELNKDLKEFQNNLAYISNILGVNLFASQERREEKFNSKSSLPIKQNLNIFFEKLEDLANEETEENEGLISFLKQNAKDTPYERIEVIRSTLIALFEAGSATVTQTVTNAIKYLSEKQALFYDIKALLNSKDNNSIKKGESILIKIIIESARYGSPIRMTFRENVTGGNVNEYESNINSLVIISIQGMLKDPKYFSDPDKFDHLRTNLDEGRTAWLLPGDRGCLGFRTSISEALEYLKQVVLNFDRIETIQKNEPPLIGATTLDQNYFKFIKTAKNSIEL